MPPKSQWRVLAEEARRVGTESLVRSLPGNGYFGRWVRRLLPADRPFTSPAPQNGARNGHAAVPADAARERPVVVSDAHRATAPAARKPTDPAAPPALAVPPSARPRSRPDVGAPDFAVGTVVATRYEVTQQLAQTTRHRVYVARHRDWRIDVVLKVPRYEGLTHPSALHDMEKGARRWITLGLHPHIAYCYQVELIDGIPVLVVEYHAGGNLRPWITSGRSANLRHGLSLAIQICHGLEHAHAHEVVHGALRPENLILTVDGTLRISDFGTGRVLPRDAPGSAVDDNAEAYVAPEQWGEPALGDARTDVFALGVCLYEMFCGTPPYESTRGPIAAPRQGAPDDTLPPQLAAILPRCVDWDPAQRPTVFEIRQVLCAVHTECLGKPSPFANLPAGNWEADGWNNQAAALWLAGRHDEAEAAWATALQTKGDHLEAMFGSSLVRWQRGELTDTDLAHAISDIAARRPNDWLAMYLQALVHLDRGDAVAAVVLLEQAAARAPDSSEVSEALAAARNRADPTQTDAPTAAGHRAHQAFVSAVCVSPDGSWVLSGGDDRTLRLWETRPGRLARTFEGHTQRVSGVSLNRGGTLVLSGSDDATLRLWDVASGQCRTTLVTPGRVVGLALSPNGRWAVSTSGPSENGLGGNGAMIQRWDLVAEHALSALQGHRSTVRTVAISGDGRRILSGSDDHTVRLWDATTGAPLLTMEGHTHFVSAVCLNATATRALSGSWDQTLRLWDIPNQRCLRTLKGHVSIVTGVALAADDRIAVSSSLDGTVRVWDLGTGRCLRTFEGHTSMVTSVATSADGSLAASGSWDATVRVWPLPRGGQSVCVPRLSTRQTYAQLPAADPEPDELLADAERAFGAGRLAVALQQLRAVRQSPAHDVSPRALNLWRALTARCLRSGLRGARLLGERPTTLAASTVHVASDPDRVLSGGADGQLNWSFADGGRTTRPLTGHTARVTALRASPDYTIAVSGSADGTARVWDLRRGTCMHVLVGHQSVVTAVDLTPGTQRVVTASYDHTLRLWEMALGQCVRVLRGHERQVLAACLTADGRHVLSAGYEPAIRLWDAANGECLRLFAGHTGAVTALCVSVDGRWLLSGGADHQLRLWSLESGDCARVLTGHDAAVVGVAVTPDGRWALSAGRDGTVRCWNLESGDGSHVVHRADGAVSAFALSADGDRALVASAAARLYLYELEWDLDPPPNAA